MIYLLAILIGFLIPLLIVSNFCEIFNLSTTWEYKWLKYTLIAIALLIILSMLQISFELIGQYSLYIFILLIIVNSIKKAIVKSKKGDK